MTTDKPLRTGTFQEFCVQWSREGGTVKEKAFRRASAARRLVTLLGPEPWKAYTDRDPDELECCSGHECGCGGETIRERAMAARAGFPPLVSVAIIVRTVTITATEWATCPTRPTPDPEAR